MLEEKERKTKTTTERREGLNWDLGWREGYWIILLFLIREKKERHV